MMRTHQGPILVVEDHADDVMLIRRAFQKAKVLCPLVVVEDGDSAVDYLQGTGNYADPHAHPLPVLVLLDLKLPRRSGLEVLEWLRQQPSLRALPVVILTSSKENADIKRAYELGANTYLSKPVEFDALLEIVKTLNLYWLVMAEQPVVQRP